MKEVINLQGKKVMVRADTPTDYKAWYNPETKKQEAMRHLFTPEREAERAIVVAEAAVDAERRGITSEINRLESQQTPRRLREHALGTDNGWLENQENLIAVERAKLEE